MSIISTGYTGLKKGKEGYRQEAQTLDIDQIPDDLIAFLVDEGYDTSDDVLTFMQRIRNCGFKIIKAT